MKCWIASVSRVGNRNTYQWRLRKSNQRKGKEGNESQMPSEERFGFYFFK